MKNLELLKFRTQAIKEDFERLWINVSLMEMIETYNEWKKATEQDFKTFISLNYSK